MSNKKTEKIIFEKTGFSSLNPENTYPKYKIPKMQRDYVWSKVNIKEFIDDLIIEYEKSQEENSQWKPNIGITYIFGNEDGVLEIIDGQQRFVTLLIIMNILDDIKQKNYFDILDADNKYYRNNINCYKDYCGGNKSATEYNKFIKLHDIITRMINTSFTERGIRNDLFLKFILDKLIFIFFKILYEDQYYDIFLKLNNRGMVLSFIDLLKTHLYKKSDEFPSALPEADVENFSNLIYSIQHQYLKGEKPDTAYKFITDGFKCIFATYIDSKTPSNDRKVFSKFKDYLDYKNYISDEPNEIPIDKSPSFRYREFTKDWIDNLLVYSCYFKNTSFKKNNLIERVLVDNNKQIPDSFTNDFFNVFNLIGKEMLRPLANLFAVSFLQSKTNHQLQSEYNESLKIILKIDSYFHFKKCLKDTENDTNDVKLKFGSIVFKYDKIFEFLTNSDGINIRRTIFLSKDNFVKINNFLKNDCYKDFYYKIDEFLRDCKNKFYNDFKNKDKEILDYVIDYLK